jgi:hypothetical protein
VVLKTRVARFFLVQNTKWPENRPNGQKIDQWAKIYQMAGKLTGWPQTIPTSSIVRPSQIYPNWDFWIENIPSGNPVENMLENTNSDHHGTNEENCNSNTDNTYCTEQRPVAK